MHLIPIIGLVTFMPMEIDENDLQRLCVSVLFRDSLKGYKKAVFKWSSFDYIEVSITANS